MYVEYSSSHLLGAGGSVVAVAVNVIGGTAYERGRGRTSVDLIHGHCSIGLVVLSHPSSPCPPSPAPLSPALSPPCSLSLASLSS